MELEQINKSYIEKSITLQDVNLIAIKKINTKIKNIISNPVGGAETLKVATIEKILIQEKYLQNHFNITTILSVAGFIAYRMYFTNFKFKKS